MTLFGMIFFYPFQVQITYYWSKLRHTIFTELCTAHKNKMFNLLLIEWPFIYFTFLSETCKTCVLPLICCMKRAVEIDSVYLKMNETIQRTNRQPNDVVSSQHLIGFFNREVWCLLQVCSAQFTKQQSYWIFTGGR